MAPLHINIFFVPICECPMLQCMYVLFRSLTVVYHLLKRYRRIFSGGGLHDVAGSSPNRMGEFGWMSELARRSDT